jgi:SAM-dependent methyltransferase
MTSGAVENPFAADWAADYHRFRPYHHERTLRRALRIVTPDRGTALDVACGTGFSTMALHRLGIGAVGVDISRSMLQVACKETGVPVVQAEAEYLPVPNRSCGLLTCSSGLHWLDPVLFWDEARRVLAPGAAMVVYDHGFIGEAQETPSFSRWYRGVYLTKYPIPPRNLHHADGEAPSGFENVEIESFTETIPLDHDRLVGYLMTQSNTIVVRTRGDESHKQVASWLNSETAPFFSSPDAVIDFGYWGRLNCLRRI